MKKIVLLFAIILLFASCEDGTLFSPMWKKYISYQIDSTSFVLNFTGSKKGILEYWDDYENKIVGSENSLENIYPLEFEYTLNYPHLTINITYDNKIYTSEYIFSGEDTLKGDATFVRIK